MNELSQSEVTYTAENVVAITRIVNGQLVWLETGSAGNRGAGLLHVLAKHASDFMATGRPGMKLGDLGNTPALSVESTGNANSTTKMSYSLGLLTDIEYSECNAKKN